MALPLQNFVAKIGPVVSAAWLNLIDQLRFLVFDGAVTKAAARVALTSDGPLEVQNGGTGARDSAGAIIALQITPEAIGADFDLRRDLLIDDSTVRVQKSLINYPKTIPETKVPVHPEWPQGVPWRYGAKGDNITPDQAALQDCVNVGVFSFFYNANYAVTGKVQVTNYCSIVGENRQNTIWKSITGFTDYILEIGNGTTASPNVGELTRLRFFGNPGNSGMLHMNTNCHMWRLHDLLFSASLCPAIVIDTCWDSSYTNIDILSCSANTSNPAASAALIMRGNCNNLYFRGLRIEQSLGGCIYLETGGPIYVDTGKIDQGYNLGQLAAAVTIATGYVNGHGPATLFMDNFQITGIYGQYAIDCTGGLYLGKVTFGGGVNNTVIRDRRAWFHLNPASFTGASAASIGPVIPAMDLGDAEFARADPSININTFGVMHSKIFPIRALNNLAVLANGAVGTNSIAIGTNATITLNDQYTGCYLVHNSTGTAYASRRKILACFIGGNMTVAGTTALPVDGDWSIEFSAQHSTPIKADKVKLANGMQLFTVLSAGAILTGVPVYQTGGVAYGTTLVTVVSALNFGPNTDATGYYLVDEQTGEPYLIGYGLAAATIGVMYDRSTTLNVGHTFSIVAGYHGGVRQSGAAYEWNYGSTRRTAIIAAADALGFDSNNIPLWGNIP